MLSVKSSVETRCCVLVEQNHTWDDVKMQTKAWAMKWTSAAVDTEKKKDTSQGKFFWQFQRLWTFAVDLSDIKV